MLYQDKLLSRSSCSQVLTHIYHTSLYIRIVCVPYYIIRLRNLKYTVVLDFRFYDSILSQYRITGWIRWKNNINGKVNKII